MVLQYFTMFFAGFIIGFVYSWKITLVMLAFTPILVILGAAAGKILAGFTSQEQAQYASAGAIAEEVISSIQTVVAFGGEEQEIER